ncbi:hypothetical protein [Micromonospora sp. HUAS LYJ1]|uniref:hypothetical protein n=1 Tax=Micromonospora sp. HUAS LYJ1 TaxID=3061626 RepID=UPI002672D1B9|nr:hypothetical protein [Micromonospora sp. HUAS LYJ1]WKU07982.1 hypothetical protein Q2K16_13615 [Micromonospora sp. HUAS LYJ1]
MTRRDPGAAGSTVATEPGRCECRHLEPLHVLGARGRGTCSASTCNCPRYAPGAGTTPAPAGPEVTTNA